jgi:GMP synthase-like glutamine amidotransferase
LAGCSALTGFHSAQFRGLIRFYPKNIALVFIFCGYAAKNKHQKQRAFIRLEDPRMIWYVDIEHDTALADPTRVAYFDGVRSERARVCAEASGSPCEAVHYRQVSWARAREQQLQAIAISGNTTDWADYDWQTFGPLFELVQSGQFPTIGLCGGHQLIGLMYGARCAAIRPLAPSEPDAGGFAPGWYKELGFQPVHVVKDDPLFAGLGQDPVFLESHYWEIKDVPQGFDLLASTAAVRVQVIRHQTLPIYGTQFHPEASTADYPDGFQLLRNFFARGK